MKTYETILSALYLNNYITSEEYHSGVIITNDNAIYYIPTCNVFENKDTEELYSTIKEKLKNRILIEAKWEKQKRNMYRTAKEALAKLNNNPNKY